MTDMSSVDNPFAASLPAAHCIDPRDDVAVALRPLTGGETVLVSGHPITVAADIPKGHKFALRPIPRGSNVLKYGWPIGRAKAAIAPGDHVHTHNLATRLADVEDYTYRPASGTRLRPLPPGLPDTFQGYRRANGAVGTRNEIWILPTVGCVARTAERIARLGSQRLGGQVDGIHALTHPFGCSQLGDDLSRTRKVLASLASHPNAGGVLIVGLGCENNQLDALLAEVPDRSRIRAFAAQMTEDETDAGLQALEDLVAIASLDRREPCPLSALTIGLKCGGSDGFSGLTTNPLVGRIADYVAGAGGTPILTEIPEVFGAERLLMARAANAEVFQDMAALLNGFKRYFLDHHQPVHENPSPGNIAGGITTLEEKSLGAVQKAGHATVTQVLRYGERALRKGLALLEAPGNDAVSSTALVAAGATLLLFTTGRGTPLGFPAPTLKIATNTALAEHKPHWIDFDAGPIAAGASMDAMAADLLRLMVDVASGKPSKNEQNGEREIALWKNGVTL
ncbi:UxaA family hydrolase [Pedomonas sp. V897]|uniref:UxaA family hydrolase n=1 Tax=Pedomonas sp. V897 TaxID=3446482 RepID=UPI003EE01110